MELSPINPLPNIEDDNNKYPEFLSGLPRDILFLIANAVDYTDIINLCKTEKHLNNICHERAFWIYLIKKRYPEFQPQDTNNVDQLKSYFIRLENRYNITINLSQSKSVVLYAYDKEQLKAILTAFFACFLKGKNQSYLYPHLEIKHRKASDIFVLSNTRRSEILYQLNLTPLIYPVSTDVEESAMLNAIDGKFSIIAGQDETPSGKVLYYVSDPISKDLFMLVFCMISVNSKVIIPYIPHPFYGNFLSYITGIMYPEYNSKSKSPPLSPTGLIRTYNPIITPDGNYRFKPDFLEIVTRNPKKPGRINIYIRREINDPLWEV